MGKCAHVDIFYYAYCTVRGLLSLSFQLKSSFDKCVALKRFKDAWSLAGAIDEVECWRALGMAALYHLDVELGECCILEV